MPKPRARAALVTGKQPPADRRDAGPQRAGRHANPDRAASPNATSAAATSATAESARRPWRTASMSSQLTTKPSTPPSERAGDRVRKHPSDLVGDEQRYARRPSGDRRRASPSADEMPPHITRQCPLAAMPSISAAPSVRPPSSHLAAPAAPDRRGCASASRSGRSAGVSISSNCPWSIAQNNAIPAPTRSRIDSGIRNRRLFMPSALGRTADLGTAPRSSSASRTSVSCGRFATRSAPPRASSTDMPIAASHGGTKPSAASGTAARL